MVQEHTLKTVQTSKGVVSLTGSGSPDLEEIWQDIGGPFHQWQVNALPFVVLYGRPGVSAGTGCPGPPIALLLIILHYFFSLSTTGFKIQLGYRVQIGSLPPKQYGCRDLAPSVKSPVLSGPLDWFSNWELFSEFYFLTGLLNTGKSLPALKVYDVAIAVHHSTMGCISLESLRLITAL